MPARTTKTDTSVEWVTLPKAGDCIALRVDPVASAEHLKSADVLETMKVQRTIEYLGIVTKIMNSPSSKKPWSKCVIYLLPQPPCQQGVIDDFQPRQHVIARIRPHRAKRVPMLSIAPPLLAELQEEAAEIVHNVDCTPSDYAAELNECHWVTTRWVVPEHMKHNRATLLPPEAMLLEPEYDVYPMLDFSYEWQGPYGSPKEFFQEYDNVTNTIIMARINLILTEQITDLEERAEESREARKLLFCIENGMASTIPDIVSIVQTGLDGITTVRRLQ